MRVLVLSRDGFLLRRAELELEGIAEMEAADEYDVTLYDCESGMAIPERCGRVIKLSRLGDEGAELLPLPRGRLAELIKTENAPALILSESDRSVSFKGKRIKLTSHEYSLLSLLAKSRGYVSREDISKNVWGEATDGLINIYVHYLREKLECDGDKVILSSRKYGYKINEKYLEEGIC
ncbi:MAG: winged helix-turn-helix domain-containing protein [Clostridia bacterium]|nr:winged helix-turn-helix domain-containing protein [Clostridia bacterium]